MTDSVPTFAVGDITATIGSDHVAHVEMHRPPNNFLDHGLARDLAIVFERLDHDTACRAILLTSEGRHFCAGAALGSADDAVASAGQASNNPIYECAIRLFSTQTPVVAAIEGAAIGGGLGLALVADFRVASPQARFSANFTRIGLHQGFGLSVTLPRVVGRQAAQHLLLTGRRIDGDQAAAIGLCDQVVPPTEVRSTAHALAAEIASAAPLAVRAVRQTLRSQLAQEVAAITVHEHQQQQILCQTHDHREGVAAYSERREPRFVGA